MTSLRGGGVASDERRRVFGLLYVAMCACGGSRGVEGQYNCESKEFCRSDAQVAFPASMGYNWEKEQREER